MIGHYENGEKIATFHKKLLKKFKIPKSKITKSPKIEKFQNRFFGLKTVSRSPWDKIRSIWTVFTAKIKTKNFSIFELVIFLKKFFEGMLCGACPTTCPLRLPEASHSFPPVFSHSRRAIEKRCGEKCVAEEAVSARRALPDKNHSKT